MCAHWSFFVRCVSVSETYVCTPSTQHRTSLGQLSRWLVIFASHRESEKKIRRNSNYSNLQLYCSRAPHFLLQTTRFNLTLWKNRHSVVDYMHSPPHLHLLFESSPKVFVRIFYCHIFLFVPKNQVIDFEIFKEKEKKQKSKRKNQNLSAILFKESEQFHSNERKKERVVVGIRLPIFKASQSAWQQLSWKLKKKKKQSQLKREKKGTVKKMALASLASPFQRVPGTFKFGDYTYEWRSLLETPCYGFNGPNACLDPTCKHDGGARFKKEQSKGQQFKQKSSTSKFLLKFNVRAISGDSDSKSSSGQEHMVYSGVNG